MNSKDRQAFEILQHHTKQKCAEIQKRVRQHPRKHLKIAKLHQTGKNRIDFSGKLFKEVNPLEELKHLRSVLRQLSMKTNLVRKKISFGSKNFEKAVKELRGRIDTLSKLVQCDVNPLQSSNSTSQITHINTIGSTNSTKIDKKVKSYRRLDNTALECRNNLQDPKSSITLNDDLRCNTKKHNSNKTSMWDNTKKHNCNKTSMWTNTTKHNSNKTSMWDKEKFGWWLKYKTAASMNRRAHSGEAKAVAKHMAYSRQLHDRQLFHQMTRSSHHKLLAREQETNAGKINPSLKRTRRPLTPRRRFIRNCVVKRLLPEPRLLPNFAGAGFAGKIVGFQGFRRGVHADLAFHSFHAGDDLVLSALDAVTMDGKSSVPMHMVDVSSCNLSDNGVFQLLSKLPKHVQKLDISNNKEISHLVYKKLGDILSNNSYHLEELGLANMANSDSSGGILKSDAMILAKSLSNNTSISHLHRLNMSDCAISNDTGEILAKALQVQGIIIDLDISWNQISCCAALFLKVESLERLRLDHNPIGGNRVNIKNDINDNIDKNNNNDIIDEINMNTENDIIDNGNIDTTNDTNNDMNSKKKNGKTFDDPVKSLACALAENETLLHIDLSYCHFTSAQAWALGDSLISNSTLLGFHINGTYLKHETKGLLSKHSIIENQKAAAVFVTNPKGFLVSRQQTQVYYDPRHVLVNGIPLDKTKNKTARKIITASRNKIWLKQPCVLSNVTSQWHNLDAHCWLCGGWNEEAFCFSKEYIKEQEDTAINWDDKSEVYLHLHCDAWEGTKMKRGAYVHHRVKLENSAILHRVLPPGRNYFFFSIKGKMVLSNMYHIEYPQKSVTVVNKDMIRNCLSQTLHTSIPVYEKARNRDINFATGQTSDIIFTNTHRKTYNDEYRISLNYIDVELRDGPLRLPHVHIRDIVSRQKKKIKKIKFNPKRSIFAPRRKHTESRAFTDPPKFMHNAFLIDWKLAHPERCRIWSSLSDENDRNAIKAFMGSNYHSLMMLFLYQSVENAPLASEKLLWTMSAHRLETLTILAKLITTEHTVTNDIHIPGMCNSINSQNTTHEKTHTMGFSIRSLDQIFSSSTVQYAHDYDGQLAEENNPKKVLTRFEFLNAILRIAEYKGREWGLFGGSDTKKNNDTFKSSDSSLTTAKGKSHLKALKKVVCSLLGATCNVDPNIFRENRLYTQSTDQALLKCSVTLRKIFNLFREEYNSTALAQHGWFSYGCWVHLIHDGTCILTGSHHKKDNDIANSDLKNTVTHDGIEFDESQMTHCFVRSCLYVRNQLHTEKHQFLSFEDFIEAICRVADAKYEPVGKGDLSIKVNKLVTQYLQPALKWKLQEIKAGHSK